MFVSNTKNVPGYISVTDLRPSHIIDRTILVIYVTILLFDKVSTIGKAFGQLASASTSLSSVPIRHYLSLVEVLLQIIDRMRIKYPLFGVLVPPAINSTNSLIMRA
jgi:hypothetical protein